MKKVETQISVEAACYCPHCREYIDLCSYLSRQCLNIFSAADDDDYMDVVCPECDEGFKAKLQN